MDGQVRVMLCPNTEEDDDDDEKEEDDDVEIDKELDRLTGLHNEETIFIISDKE